MVPNPPGPDHRNSALTCPALLIPVQTQVLQWVWEPKVHLVLRAIEKLPLIMRATGISAQAIHSGTYSASHKYFVCMPYSKTQKCLCKLQTYIWYMLEKALSKGETEKKQPAQQHHSQVKCKFQLEIQKWSWMKWLSKICPNFSTLSYFYRYHNQPKYRSALGRWWVLTAPIIPLEYLICCEKLWQSFELRNT